MARCLQVEFSIEAHDPVVQFGHTVHLEQPRLLDRGVVAKQRPHRLMLRHVGMGLGLHTSQLDK
jgi:hypothetical protein